MICVLDCGDPATLRGNPLAKEYGYSLAEKNWDYIEVSNPEFIKTFPVAGVQLNDHEMFIFGGETTKTFIFDTNKINQKKAEVKTASAQLDKKAKFGFKTDFVS